MWHVINRLIWYGNVNNPLKLRPKRFEKLIFHWSFEIISSFEDDTDDGDEWQSCVSYGSQKIVWHANTTRNKKSSVRQVEKVSNLPSLVLRVASVLNSILSLYLAILCSISVVHVSMQLAIDRCLFLHLQQQFYILHLHLELFSPNTRQNIFLRFLSAVDDGGKFSTFKISREKIYENMCRLM